MRMILLVFIITLFSFATLADSTHLFKLNLHYSNQTLSLRSINVVPYEPYENGTGNNIAEVISLDHTLLILSPFSVSKTVIADNFDENGNAIGGKMFEKDNGDFTLFLPYFPNAKTINLYDQELHLALTIPVTDFAKERSPIKITSNRENGSLKPVQEQSYTPSRTTHTMMYIIGGLILLVLITIILLIINKLSTQKICKTKDMKEDELKK